MVSPSHDQGSAEPAHNAGSLVLEDVRGPAESCVMAKMRAIQVTKANVYNVVVKGGFQKYDDVYRDIAAGQRPPVPAGQTSALPAGTAPVPAP